MAMIDQDGDRVLARAVENAADALSFASRRAADAGLKVSLITLTHTPIDGAAFETVAAEVVRPIVTDVAE
jgi:hypothetical protein